MNKARAGMFAVVCVFMLASLALAQEQKPAQDKPMMERRDRGMKMHGMMMGMMPRQMVASNDGGVIVLAGNKLYKYDKNLTLVKEAEIKVDMEDMKGNCPMMKNGEKPGNPEEEGDMDMTDMPMPPK